MRGTQIKEQALILHGLAQLCVLPPAGSKWARLLADTSRGGAAAASSSRGCDLGAALAAADVFGVGLRDAAGLELLNRMLAWDAHDRISLDEARRHVSGRVVASCVFGVGLAESRAPSLQAFLSSIHVSTS